MTRVSELFGLLAQLAEETAEEVDDDDGIDGVWDHDVPAGTRDFDHWVVAVNFDPQNEREYRTSEYHPPVSLKPGRGRVWPESGDDVPVALVSAGGGRVVGMPDDDLEGELIRDVRAELERVQSSEEIVTDGGTDSREKDGPWLEHTGWRVAGQFDIVRCVGCGAEGSRGRGSVDHDTACPALNARDALADGGGEAHSDLYRYCTHCGERLSEYESELAQNAEGAPICMNCFSSITEEMVESVSELSINLARVVGEAFGPLLSGPDDGLRDGGDES